MSDPVVVESVSVAIAARVPVLLWGDPGIGKTSAVTALAAAAGLPIEVVVASVHDPTDFSGLPVVDGDGVRFVPPGFARRLADAGRGLLFLDEISTAPPAVQAALLRVVLERTVGDCALGDDVAIVAAANPPESAADGWDLSAPLANRFCHLDWRADPAAFIRGFTSGFAVPDPTVVPVDWERFLPEARALVAAFIGVRPTLLVDVPSGAAAGRAWPSPRSWESTARLLAASRAAGSSDDVVRRLVAGTVGEGPATELLAFQADLDLPDPESLLADPHGCELPDRADRTWAVLTAVASAVSVDTTAERWVAACVVLGRVGEHLPDVAAAAGRAVVELRPADAVPPPELAALLPVLQQSGLLAARAA